MSLKLEEIENLIKEAMPNAEIVINVNGTAAFKNFLAITGSNFHFEIDRPCLL